MWAAGRNEEGEPVNRGTPEKTGDLEEMRVEFVNELFFLLRYLVKMEQGLGFGPGDNRRLHLNRYLLPAKGLKELTHGDFLYGITAHLGIGINCIKDAASLFFL